MKKKRFAVEQIVAVLKEAEAGMPVAELIRRIGITEQTFYRWKKQYAGLDSDQARQLKQLQEENDRLKKIVAELSLDKAMLADVIKKSGESSSSAFYGAEGYINKEDARNSLQIIRRHAAFGKIYDKALEKWGV